MRCIRLRTLPLVLALMGLVGPVSAQVRFDTAPLQGVFELPEADPVTLTRVPDPDATATVLRGTYNVPATDAVLEIETTPAGSPVWTVEVRAARDAESVLQWTGLLESGKGLRSSRVPNAATVELRTKVAGGVMPPAVQAKVRYSPKRTHTPQGITGKHNGLEPVATLKAGQRFPARWEPAARSVGKLWIRMRDGRVGHGTAFLISPTHILTNHHCAPDRDKVSSIVVGFDYDEHGTVTDRYEVTEWGAGSPTLDFRVLKIDRPVDRPVLEWAASRPYAERPLMILQHPLQEPLHWSVADCRVVALDLANGDFGHGCDTSIGSSGSPILDFLTGEVVGLHHLGTDEAARQFFNRGVPMTLIEKALGAEALKAMGRKVRSR
jgi:hypothetical protein